MNSKPKRTMKVKLSSIDILEISKALKCGWLDMCRVAGFKSLLDGYNPPKEITQRQVDYYCECLYKGLGYTPTDEDTMTRAMLAELPTDLKEEWGESIEDGSLYKKLVRDAFLGMVAMRALGGKYTPNNGDYGFCGCHPDFEI